MIVGLPGILLAALVRAFLRDPPRGHFDGGAAAGTPAASESTPSLGDTFGFMRQLRSFRHLAIAGALHALYGYGAGAFLPSFLFRVHEMSAAEVGTYLGGLTLVAGGLGTFLGGAVGDWTGERDKRWYLWIPGIGTLLAIPFQFVVYLHSDSQVAILAMLPSVLFGTLYLGPTFAMTQSLVPPNMRAVASAVLLLILNLIGMGLGPQFVGFLSDLLEPRYGIESIRYALFFTVVPAAAWSIVHYIIGARYLRDDLERQHQIQDAPAAF